MPAMDLWTAFLIFFPAFFAIQSLYIFREENNRAFRELVKEMWHKKKLKLLYRFLVILMIIYLSSMLLIYYFAKSFTMAFAHLERIKKEAEEQLRKAEEDKDDPDNEN